MPFTQWNEPLRVEFCSQISRFSWPPPTSAWTLHMKVLSGLTKEPLMRYDSQISRPFSMMPNSSHQRTSADRGNIYLLSLLDRWMLQYIIHTGTGSRCTGFPGVMGASFPGTKLFCFPWMKCNFSRNLMKVLILIPETHCECKLNHGPCSGHIRKVRESLNVQGLMIICGWMQNVPIFPAGNENNKS